MDEPYDVIIVGAGPVGLFLSCELALAGVSVLVLEREAKAKLPIKDSSLGRRGLNVSGIEAFYRRDLLDQLFGEDRRPAKYEPAPGFQFVGHFAGIMMDASKLDLSRWKYYLPSPAAYPGATVLSHVESVLCKRAESMGVQILRGCTISRVADMGEHMEVLAGEQQYKAQWLVGCDGGRSFVRKAAGFEFVGTDAEFYGYIATCDLDRPELLKRGFNPTKTGMYIKSDAETVYAIDFDMEEEMPQEVTREHFQEVLRRVSGTDVVVEQIRLSTSWTARSRQVTEYRRGRVFLAGDAAHIHPPLGAQGLNAGIGDAMNLGWKLAATVKGHAPPGLLDTYHQERHPVGKAILDWCRAQVAILRPDPFAKSISNVVRELMSNADGTNYFIDRFWGLSLRYEGDPHPLVGCSVPDFECEDEVRVGTKLQGGSFLVVNFERDAGIAEFVLSMRPLVYYCESEAKETFGLRALLVRPDGIVAWVSEEECELSALRAALLRWTSIPTLGL